MRAPPPVARVKIRAKARTWAGHAGDINGSFMGSPGASCTELMPAALMLPHNHQPRPRGPFTQVPNALITEGCSQRLLRVVIFVSLLLLHRWAGSTAYNQVLRSIRIDSYFSLPMSILPGTQLAAQPRKVQLR